MGGCHEPGQRPQRWRRGDRIPPTAEETEEHRLKIRKISPGKIDLVSHSEGNDLREKTLKENPALTSDAEKETTGSLPLG